MSPIRGAYAFNDPGGAVDLYRGEGELDGSRLGPTRIWVSMRRGLKVQWQSTVTEQRFEFDGTILSINHPQLGIVNLPVDVIYDDGRGMSRGVSPGAELGNGDRLVRVVTHWINLPLISPGASVADGRESWSGRWKAESCGWSLTLDARPDCSEVLRTANELDEQYVMTHVAELRRSDHEEFDAMAASNVLFGWQLAMSFALGRWVAPALPVGFDPEERRVWEQWAPWRCDTMSGYESWWDTHNADGLGQFVDAYLKAYLDVDQHEVVRWVAMHVITANHSGTTAEGKVMLAQAGLEYLAWVTLVLSGRVAPKTYKAMPAAERLRLLLVDARIPPEVPRELDALHELATQDHFDGPDAAAWVRNRLVHPKDAGEPYRIGGLVWQTAQLLLQYGELLLLHRLGYSGRFMRRYPPHRWAHSSEPVPWS